DIFNYPFLSGQLLRQATIGFAPLIDVCEVFAVFNFFWCRDTASQPGTVSYAGRPLMYHMDNLLSALGPFLEPMLRPHRLLFKWRSPLIKVVLAKPRFLPHFIAAGLNRALGCLDCALKLC